MRNDGSTLYNSLRGCNAHHEAGRLCKARAARSCIGCSIQLSAGTCSHAMSVSSADCMLLITSPPLRCFLQSDAFDVVIEFNCTSLPKLAPDF